MRPPSYHDYEDEREGGESFDFMRFYYALKERSWIVLLCVLAAGFLTYGYLKRAPNIYAATVVLQVDLEKPNILNKVADVQPDDRSPEAGKTLEKLLQSRALLERVLISNNLATDPRFSGGPQVGEPNKEKMLRRLDGMVNVQAQYGTKLLSVVVEHSDRLLAMEIATAVVDQFALQNYEQHLGAVEGVTKLLAKDEQRMRAKVEESERSLHAYREGRGAVSLEGGQDIVVQTMKDYNQKLTDAAVQRLTLEGEFQQVQKIGTDMEALLKIKSIVNSPAVASSLGKLAQQKVKIGNLAKKWLPKHPGYILAMGELYQWEEQLTNATLQAVQTLSNAYTNAAKTEESFKARLKEQEAAVFALEKDSIEYNNLVREAKANREMYETVLGRMKETMITKGWAQNKVSVVQTAYAPEKPIRPEKQRILLIGVLIGLALGLAIALGLELIDTTIKTPDQAGALLDLPILSAIPRLRSVEKGRRQVVMSEDGESNGAEAFRTLRTTLSMLGPEGTRRTFLFTSAVPEEGKTFSAVNYAYTLAQQGHRTLLVEADLRCPAVERALPFALKSTPGLSDYLTGSQNFEAVVQPSDHSNLSVIIAGTRAPNASELLGQDGFSALLQEALLHFDRVVVDSAPVQPVSDTLLLANKVQTVCLVVCADCASRKAVQRALQMLRKAEAPVAGLIFNRLSQTRGQHYYDYSYYPEYVERGTDKV